MSLFMNFFSVLVANDYILGNGAVHDIISVLNSYGSVRQMSVLYRPEMEAWAGEIASRLDIPVLLNVRQHPRRDRRVVGDPNSIVLVLDDKLTASDVLNTTLRYHSTIYLMIVRSGEEVESQLEEFWKELVISAYVLIINNTSDTSDGLLFGFEPKPDGIILKKMNSLEAVRLFDSHGAPANVSVVTIPPAVIMHTDKSSLEGFEGRIIKEVIRKFNLTASYANPRDGEMWGWPGPKPIGVLGEVNTGYSAFGFGMLAATAARTEYVDQFAGYARMECNTWVVPKGAGAAAPIWIAMLLTEYQWNVWLGLIVSSVAILIAYAIIDGSGIVSVLFRTFAVSIGAPVQLPFKTTTRILTVVWVWSSFVIAVAYQASMGSKLAVPPAKPDIDTYANLIDSDLEFLSLRNPIDLMLDEHPQLHALKIRTSHSDLSMETLLERIATKRDLAYMRQRTTIRYYIAQHPLSAETLHITSSCSLIYQHSISMGRWSPFFKGTSKIVQWLMEFGLIAKWERDFMPEFHSISRPSGALGMKQLLGVFVMLSVGHGISVIAFIFELLWKKIDLFIRRKRKSTKIKHVKIIDYCNSMGQN